MNTLITKIIAMFFVTIISFSTMALPKFPGGFGGGDSKEESSVDLPSAQVKLERTLRDGLADLMEAESHFANARGDADAAAANKIQADTLRGKDDVNIKEAIEATASSREKSAEFEANAGELSAESKALYAKGLLPYAKGISKQRKKN